MCNILYIILFALVLQTITQSSAAAETDSTEIDLTLSKRQGNSYQNKTDASQQPNDKTKKAKPQKPSQANLGKGKKHAGVAVEISLQAANSTANFEWTLVSISEVGPLGVYAVLSNLTTLSFLNISTDPVKQRWSSMLINGAELIFELWSVSQAVNVTFASQTLLLLPDTLKQTLRISNWPWQSSLNHLELQLFLSDTASNSTTVVNTSEDNAAVYLQLNSSVLVANGTQLDVAVLKWAEIDNATAPLNITAASEGLVLMSVPHFVTTALLDPRFSVLIDVDTPPGGDDVIMPANTLSSGPTEAPMTSSSTDTSVATSYSPDTSSSASSSPTSSSSATSAAESRSRSSSSRTKMILAGAVSGAVAVVAVAIAITLLMLRKNPAVKQVFHSTRHRRSSVVSPQTVTHEVISP